MPVRSQLTTVGEGEECNGSLPPTLAVLCGDDLYCKTTSTMRGASGTCVKCVPEVCGPPVAAGSLSSNTRNSDSEAAGVLPLRSQLSIIGEGEECNGSLPPAFAVLCDDELYSKTA